MSVERERPGMWAWLWRAPAGSARPDEGVVAWAREDEPDLQMRAVLDVIADLAGWSAAVPFDVENAEHAETLRQVVDQLEAEARGLRYLLDRRLATLHGQSYQQEREGGA